MKVWRLNIKTAAKSGVNPRQFCLKNNFLGVGYAISQTGEVDWQSYIKEAKVKYKGWGRSFTAAINAVKHRMNINDLCWTRDHDGNYFLGVITSDWEYKNTEEHLSADVVNIRHCKWLPVGTVDAVPGKVVNSYISGSTVQQVKGEEVRVYSQYLANTLLKENLYSIQTTENILSLLSSDDCEDLVALYMQKKHGFMVIPSSCKKDSAVYEYVMKHPETGRKAVAQVKHGAVDLNMNKYHEVDADVFLLTTKGQYKGESAPNITCLQPENLTPFATENYKLMPDSVQNWLDFAKKQG